MVGVGRVGATRRRRRRARIGLKWAGLEAIDRGRCLSARGSARTRAQARARGRMRHVGRDAWKESERASKQASEREREFFVHDQADRGLMQI